MRYVVALLVAALVIGAGALYSWRNHDLLERSIREGLREQQREGKLPPEWRGIDPDTVDLKDLNFMMSVPTDVLERWKRARILARWWYYWAPAVVAVCLGAATLYSWWRGLWPWRRSGAAAAGRVR